MIFGIIFSFLIQPSFAGTDAIKDQDVLCKNGKVVRTLSFRANTGKNECSTVYNKGGKDREIGRGQSPSVCRGVFDQVRGTLEKADWKCKDISNLQVFEN